MANIKQLFRIWWVQALGALIYAAVTVQNVVHPVTWGPWPVALLAVVCPAFVAVVVAVGAKDAWEITRHREPRIVGLTGFRRVLQEDLAHANHHHRSVALRAPDSAHVIGWYQHALDTATTPAAAEDIYREWQVTRPTWLGHRRGNVIFDPARAD